MHSYSDQPAVAVQSPGTLVQDDPLLTIVIPCKNEVHYIGKLFQSLERQSYDLSRVPVYVADAGSTDGTLELIEVFRQRNKLDIRVIPGGYPSAARNNGARMASSEYILFLDSDVQLLQDDFIEQVVKSAEERNLDCVGTLVKSINGDWRDRLIWSALTGAMYLSAMYKPFSSGMCIFMRRSAFERLGGFDEQVILGEDIELTSQVDKHKYGIVHRHVLTSNRRYARMGYARTMLMYTKTLFSRKYRHLDHSEYFS